ncbi:helix-turn-helix domain-containing protein [Flavobacterium galactosidilyticum]|uniref:helix-turn-helix domain-containing protein n=1 Tax=Flavobacterium galactosidilyticum TaxID=2893886 RepID=UPI001E2B5931|nr:helix-turn-helix transcriptional regulator [Flavobacterium sp. F-340]UFH45721.1 helix-turn-helix domain-containing protein [Flavobacterium sp. F-340]
MVNIEDFIKRLETLLDYYSLNASSFADKIGVQRSSLSHLLSGRNKPSLDFILKILEVFPDVDLYWILNGKGTFPKNYDDNSKIDSITEGNKKENTTAAPFEESTPQNLFSEISNPVSLLETKNVESQNFAKGTNSSEIDKIVVFYTNGTFKSYNPS